MAVQPVRPALANDQDQNQVKSLPWSELQDVRRDKAFRCQTAKISLKSQRHIVAALANFCLELLEPGPWVRTVDNAAEKS